MKNNINLSEQTFEEVKPIRPPVWTRLWRAYQEKMRTDRSFFATVVAFQVFFLILAFLVGTAIVIKKSNLGPAESTRLFKK